MSNNPAKLAMVFDFDDTLVPDSTSKLLRTRTRIDPDRFFQVDAKSLKNAVAGSYPLSIRIFFSSSKNSGRPPKKSSSSVFPNVRRSSSVSGPSSLPRPMLSSNSLVRQDYRNIVMEFYIVSGGLQSIIEGSKIVHDNFKAVYGCQLDGDQDGVLRYIKRCVTFTEKTRYLFEINKGKDSDRNPLRVNEPVPPEKRRVPFRNIIYVGDGLTDIPCFSLVKERKGLPFGVFDPTKKKSARQALVELLKPDRVISVHSPKYGSDDDLGSLLRMAVANRCSQIQLERELTEKLDDY
jgi:hypothetical protein